MSTTRLVHVRHLLPRATRHVDDADRAEHVTLAVHAAGHEHAAVRQHRARVPAGAKFKIHNPTQNPTYIFSLTLILKFLKYRVAQMFVEKLLLHV